MSSYIQDTTDYLKKMYTLNPLSNNTILGSMGVCTLLINIPKMKDKSLVNKHGSIVVIKFLNRPSGSVAETSSQKQQFCIKQTALFAD